MNGVAIVLAEWATHLAVLALVVGTLCTMSWHAVGAAPMPPASQPAAASSAPATRHAEIRVARPAAAATQPAPIRPSAELRQEYDKDHDGTLSEPERQAMMQDLSRQVQQQVLALMLQRYDADKNGALDDQERARMYPGHEELSQQALKAQGQWLYSWDLDGDDKISPEEERQMRAESARLQAEYTTRSDLDGDGKVSNQERNIMEYAASLPMEKRRLEMDTDGDGQASLAEQQAYWRSVAAKYDLDADGLLNTQERQQMREQEDLQAEYWLLAWTLGGARAKPEPPPATQPGM